MIMIVINIMDYNDNDKHNDHNASRARTCAPDVDRSLKRRGAYC